MINETVLNDIRSKADIVDVIQRYLPLVKKGKNYFGLCPFHDDHDPSMSISIDKQIYKCFVCGAGGNVFNFVKDYEKIHFNEAVIKVAEYITYPLELDSIQTKRPIDPKIQAYFDVLNEYVKYTRYTLNSQVGQSAKQYLIQRGMHDPTLQRFDIGYNPEDDAATQFLLAKNHTLEHCTQTNVTRINEYGHRDVFQQRITFPIHNPNGQVIGFTARSINPNEGSKYINTTETALYTKGKVLYNYHRAQKAAKEARCLILVEGVMDAIALDQASIQHVVASLGTACTIDQVRLIKQLSQHVILCYDADEAGQTAMVKLGKVLQDQNLKVSVILNKTDQDLDEIALESSIKLKQLIENPIHFTEFLFEYHLKRFNVNNYSERKAFASMMMQEINGLKDTFDQSTLIQKLTHITQFTQEQLVLLRPSRTQDVSSNRIQVHRSTSESKLKDWPEKEILSQMIASKQAMNDFRKELGYFPDELYQTLALRIMHHFRQHDDLVIADFMSGIEEAPLRNLISELAESDVYFHAYAPEALQDAFLQVKINSLEAEIFAFKQKYKEDLALSQDLSIVGAYQELLVRRQKLHQMKGTFNHGKNN